MPEIARAGALQMPLVLEVLGIVVGAVTGTLTACERKLDVVGGVGLAMICGLGGGLIRDVIMQVGSVFMLESGYAIPLCAAVGLVVFFFHSAVEHWPEAIEWLDILGVALFAVAGCDKAIVYGLTPAASVLMGVLTGNGGGLLRDIVLGDVPKIFQKANWYAICALFGSLAYWVLVGGLGLEKGPVAIVSVLVTIAARRAALRFDLQSPADVDLTSRVRESIHRAARGTGGARRRGRAKGRGRRPDERD